jgi:hypothetical protein
MTLDTFVGPTAPVPVQAHLRVGLVSIHGGGACFQLLKVAGWNILRASSSMRLMASLKGLFAAMAGLIQSLVNQLQMKAFHPQ